MRGLQGCGGGSPRETVYNIDNFNICSLLFGSPLEKNMLVVSFFHAFVERHSFQMLRRDIKITDHGPQKSTSAPKKSADRQFFGSRVQTSSPFSTPLEPINAEFLPDGAIYSKNPPGNAFKSKFERMDLILISISNP